VDGDPEFDRREHDARHLEMLESSDEAEDAMRRLRDLLGVSADVASEVLNIQWRRLTRQGSAELIERRDALRARR
jgi:hypothetical protein